MFASYALSIARRSRGFIPGSAPPRRAATVTSLISRVKVLPFLESAAAFLWRMLAHLECPDIRGAARARFWCGTAYNFNKSRSEEHTSELQSRPHLLFRLLLEKKKESSCSLV